MAQIYAGSGGERAADLKAERERGVKMIRELMKQKPWADQPWARCALAVAANAIERGRLLTEREKLLNLADAMEEPDGDGESFADVAAKLRAIAGA